MKRVNIVCLVTCLLFVFVIQNTAWGEEPPVKIGVLAKRGLERCMEKWSPTAKYLTDKIPGKTFVIVPLYFREIYPSVKKGEVDFILANSSFYVELENWYGVNRIATLKNKRIGRVVTKFGGLIFCKADRKDIQALNDLKGKIFMAAKETSLGGWRMALRELKEKGIDPYKDFKDIRFGGTHDMVVYAVRDGIVDVGTVRTDTLERIASDGKIDINTFRIINDQSGKHEDFPFIHSTRLYPEWPFARLKHTSDELAEKVAIAILEMPADSPAAIAARCAGWTIPLNYQPVHECLKELSLGPYKDYGKITPYAVVKKYWAFILAIAILFAAVLGFAIFILRLNRNIRLAHLELQSEVHERKKVYEALRETEEQLRQVQKLRAIGQLAGGIAHDFNNIIQAIHGYADISLMKINQDDPLYKNLNEIKNSTIRADNLTRQLILFSRRQPMEMKPLGLNSVIQDLTNMLSRLIGEDISLTIDLESELWTVNADAGTVEQAIMNITVNAKDAMPDGGKLNIKTQNVDIDKEYCRVYTYARQGKFVCLMLEDTGVGMDKPIIDRIFEPFFTTRGLGKGTGMGLSVVYGIVKQHKGWINVESSPNIGTIFKIYLPAVSIKPEKKQEAPVSLGDLIGKGERILVIEDEEAVMDITTKRLSENGYKVFAAANVKEAMDIFEKEKGDFDLVFADIVLPDGRGPELVDKLLELKPGIKVLYTSGYSDERSDWLAIKNVGYPYLQKPYLLNDLLKVVKDTLMEK